MENEVRYSKCFGPKNQQICFINTDKHYDKYEDPYPETEWKLTFFQRKKIFFKIFVLLLIPIITIMVLLISSIKGEGPK